MRNTKLIIVLIAVFLAAGVVWAGGKTEAGSDMEPGERRELRDTTIILEWIPNTNHTGVFVAVQKGWYEEVDLDLEVKQPAETLPPLLVASGTADFGFASQEAVTFARTSENPIPVISIAAVNRHNTSVFASPADRGIDSIKDFEGKTYGGWGSEFEEALLKAVMQKAGADYSTVKIVNVGTTDFFASFRQGIDFRWIFYGWDGVRAEVEDRAFNFIPLIDIDPKLDYYTPTIITGKSMIEEEPDLVRAFLRATERGYRYAAENPEEAADILLTYNTDLDKEFAYASQRYLSKQYLGEEGEWGVMGEKLWRNFGDFLYEYGLLPKPFDHASAYTNKFLP